MLYLQTMLDELDIKVTRFKHEAVFNCAQANLLLLDIPETKKYVKSEACKASLLDILNDKMCGKRSRPYSDMLP